MNDFKSFLDKVLSPIEGGAAAVPNAGPTEGQSASGETLTAQEIERRYAAAVNVILDDADQRKAWHIFVDVLASTLASVACRWGPGSAGDIVRRLGNHMVQIARREQAQREAEEAKNAGRKPH